MAMIHASMLPVMMVDVVVNPSDQRLSRYHVQPGRRWRGESASGSQGCQTAKRDGSKQ
jgi:hypothetical protein